MTPRPKALLFDIGGVVVVSPMAAIAEYERSNSMPPGWINFSISRSGPTGAWAKVERGEVKLDAAFFEEFTKDLTREDLWRVFLETTAAGKKNISAKDSNSSNVASQSVSAMSAAGADSEPPKLPPVPTVDAEWLYWEMMRISRDTDPDMFSALKKLRASGQFLIGALSNTTIFPVGHPYNEPRNDVASDYKSLFSVFVSSAHVGMRKPEPAIYSLALKMMQEEWSKQGRNGELTAANVLFLDDIGTNLAQARRTGFRTLKVILGDTKSAVRELEKMTGMKLLDDLNAKL